MRRILLLNTDLEIGGTPTVIRELAIRLRDASSAHIEVACLARWGPVADQIAKAGIPVTALNARGAFDFLVIHRFIKLIAQRRIDTVFSFLVHANTTAAAASRFCAGVRFFQAIQTTQPRPAWHWPVQAVAQYAAEKIIVPSQSVAAVARDRAGVPAEKIIVIPNAIDARDATTSSTIAIEPSAFDGITPIGFIGRLDPVKHVPDLVLAMQWVERAHLHIFGSGQQRSELEELIARLNLGPRVTLRGPTAGPNEALAQIRLLVLPSEAEGFPLVLIEAMSAGVPIVATNAPGIRDVIIHDQTGLLVPVSSPRSLAAAIQSLVDHPDRRSNLARAAFANVMERFTWDKVIPQYLRLLGIEGKQVS